MRNHHARKSIKSLIASHTDLEKEEQLKGSKTEIEVRVTKALKLIKEEEELEKKDGIEAVGSPKEPLAELILDLHQKYESLYAQYDNLTGELKKRVHAKQDQGSSSSSNSDSESDSSNDKGSRNGNSENDSQRMSDSFKQELEMANAENTELRRKLTDTKSQKDALSVEYQMVLSKLQEAEENNRDLRTEAQKIDNEKSKMMLENKELHQKLDIAAKIDTEKETTMHRIEQEEKALNGLKDATSQFKDENAFLQQEFQAVKEEVCHLKKLLESVQSDKQDMEGQLEKAVGQAEKLMKENKGLQARISELEISLKEREDGLSALSRNLQDNKNESATRAADLTAQLENMVSDANALQLQKKDLEELDTLQMLKNQMEQQFDIQKEKFSASVKKIESEKVELINQLAEQQKMLKDKEDACEKLMQENKQIEALLQDCQVRVQEAEKKMGQMAEQFRKKSGSKESMVTYLEDIIEDLKRDLEVKKDEVRNLVESASATEFNLRLSNQKIRITEQLLTEKEECFRELEVKYQQEVAVLEERIAKLCQALDSHRNMIRDTSEQVNDKLTGLETVVEKFVRRCEDYENYILKFSNELQIVKNCVMRTINEKEQLSQAVNQLTAQLENEKEQHLLLKKQAENLKVISGNEEEEPEILAKLKNQLEKRVEDMQMNILALAEEKKEAIRQLCIWVDYHQSRYNCLKEMMSKDHC